MKTISKRIASVLLALLAVVTCFSVFAAPKSAAAENVTISFKSASSAGKFTYSNNLLVMHSADEEAMLLAVAGGDPYVLLNVEGSLSLSADVYKYVVVTYRVPATNSSAAVTTELFMCAGDIAGPTANYSVLFNPSRGYKYRSEIVNMTSASYWKGQIHAIRFDAFTSASVWDSFYLASVTFCSDAASASAAAASDTAEANGVLENVSESTLASNAFNLDTYTQKYWNGSIVYNEAVYPLCNADGTISDSRLMYDVKKIVSVRDGTLQREYKYGADWTVIDGKFHIVPGGAIPTVAYTDYYKTSLPSGSSSWMPCIDGRYTYFSESGDIHCSQLAITYTHEDSWDGFVPESKTDILSGTYAKLRNKQHLSVVFFGDSVSVGCNASGLSSINTSPYMPIWSDMTVASLMTKYGYTDISCVNTAVGGMTSEWGAEQASARVAAYSPDLVFIGFGTNDGTLGMSTADYKANMKSIINTVRAVNPNCEFILVSPVLPNQDTLFAGVQQSYIPVLAQIESEYDGVASIDLMTFYLQLLARKKFSDMTGNNVNHPNDFFIRFFVQSIMTALSPSDIEEAKGDALRALNTYVSLSDYRPEERATVTAIISDGTAAINASETVAEVRAALSAAKALIDEVQTAAEYEAEHLDYTYLKFNSAATMTTVKKLNNMTSSVNTASGYTTFSSTGNDPYLRISYADGHVSADAYKYITIVYKVPQTVSGSPAAQIFFTTDVSTGETEASSFKFTAEKGDFSFKVIDLSSASFWSGNIRNIRIDPFATYTAGDSISLHSIRLFESFEEASAFGARCANSLSPNYEGIYESVQFDTESETDRLSSNGGVKYAGDVNGNGAINAQDYVLLKKLIVFVIPDGVDLDLADANRDGKISAKDLLILKKCVAGALTPIEVAAPNADISYSAEGKCALLEATTASGAVSVDVSDKYLSADGIKYVTLIYKNNTSSALPVSVYLERVGEVADGASVSFTAQPSDSFASVTLDFSSVLDWYGSLDTLGIGFDGASLCLGGIILSETASAAQNRGQIKALSLNRMTGQYTPAVGQNVVPLNDTTTMATFANYTSVSGTSYTYSSGMTLALDRQPDEKFDRLTIRYTASTITRGVIAYTVNGIARTDEFFLEASSAEAVFRTIIPGYFRGECANDIVAIVFYPVNASSSTFSLKGISTEDCGNYNGEIYMQNDEVKVGVLLSMGGGISYYEKLDDNNPNYSNLLNRYDVGRLIQQSYYGIDRAPYVLGTMGGDPWGYNPVQGGDRCNNPSQIVDLEVSDTEIYVKVRPMDWGHDGHITPSYMENWYYLYDSFVKVDNRFVDFSGYTHTVGWQELPAFYTVSALNNFYYYNGSSPWTGDSLIKRSDLIFWGATNNQAFDLKSTSEFWSAWCDDSGFGVGLYVPGVYTLHAGKFGYDGSPSPDAPSTNYVAPRRNMTLIVGKPLTFSYLIAAGSVSQIRNTFRDNRGLVNNYALEHYNG